MMFSGRSWLNVHLFGIPEEEALFSRRGFAPAAPAKQKHLEFIGQSFISGYRLALGCEPLDELHHRLNRFDTEFRGFAFEGAGMALALTDSVWRLSRFDAFLAGPGAAHGYMLHVGFGWAVARLPWMRWNPGRTLRRRHPLLGSLVVDGYGFHEGYFHWRSAILDARVPAGLGGFEHQFDQGLGRSLWFINGADVIRTLECLKSFASHRHADLWSGIGLAATYAGGSSRSELEQLRDAAGAYATQVAQGAAFAAKARQKAGNVVPSTEMATRVFCGMPVSEAARITDAALETVTSAEPSYENWRAEIRKRFSQTGTQMLTA